MADTRHADADSDTPVGQKRRRISGHTRGDTLAGGWGLVLFGMIFVGVGVTIVLMAADVIPTDDSNIHVSRWVFGVIGGVFAMPGLLIVLRGLRGSMRQARLKTRAQQHPEEPALGDHEWDRTGSRDEGKRGIVGSFVAGALISLFALPFLYVGFFEDGGIPFAIGGIVVALVGCGALAYAVYLLRRRLKYGGGRIEFPRFPFRTGEMLEARWIGDKPIHNYHRITFTLRCIEEKIEVSGTGKNRNRRHVRYERWADTFDVEGPGEYAGGTPISITFYPPADAPSTALRENPPRYWECEIHAQTPGIDFRHTYLLPVYAPTSA